MRLYSRDWATRTACGVIACGLLALPCRAELDLSLSIHGSAGEIAKVLELLQSSGLSGGGPMKVQVESTFARPQGDNPQADASPATPTPPPPPPPPPPTPALGNPNVAPAVVAPGMAALISVDVVDPERKVDTIAAVVGDKALTGDLVDNGTKGDVAAGDGRWTLLLHMPETFADGGYTISFQAFDAQGVPVSTPGPDGKPKAVTASALFNVRHK